MQMFAILNNNTVRLKHGVLILLLLLPLTAFAEIRSLWVMPWSLTSKAKIDSIIDNAINSGQNELLLEVRYRSDALYTTNRRSQRFPNPEPRSYVLTNSDFDPLEYAIKQAHKANLKVQAWVVVFNATPLDKEKISQNYIYQNHNDWITHDNKSNKMRSVDQFGYYIDPGVPEAQEYLLNVLCDIVDGYPELDGLHLDYIRYPNISMGFHPTSVERFNAYNAENPELTWNEWRSSLISGFVERLYTMVKNINPNVMLTAAVIANYSEAVNLYAQEWEKWLANGYIDKIYPMLYNADSDLFKRNLSRIGKMPRQNDIIMGLRAFNGNGSSLALKNGKKRNTYTIYEVKDKIDIVRNYNFGGLALFSYESLLIDNALFDLARMAFPTRIESQITAVSIPESIVEEPTNIMNEVQIVEGEISLKLFLPQEGRWKWEVRSSDGAVMFQRYRYYLKGENTEYWNGILDDGNMIKNGVYTIHIYNEEQQTYIQPLILENFGS